MISLKKPPAERVMYVVAGAAIFFALTIPLILADTFDRNEIVNAYQNWQALSGSLATLAAGVLAYAGATKQARVVRNTAESERQRLDFEKEKERSQRRASALIAIHPEISDLQNLFLACSLLIGRSEVHPLSKVERGTSDLIPNVPRYVAGERVDVMNSLDRDSAIKYAELIATYWRFRTSLSARKSKAQTAALKGGEDEDFKGATDIAEKLCAKGSELSGELKDRAEEVMS